MEAWAVDPLDGPQVDFLNIPRSSRWTRGRRPPRRSSAGGPWVRGSTASSDDRGPRRSRARRAAGAGRSVVAELDDLLARPTTPVAAPRPGRGRAPGLAGGRTSAFATAISAAIRDDDPAGVRALSRVPRRRDRARRPRATSGRASARCRAATRPTRRLVRAHTTLDLAPEAIHRIGLDETARIDGEFGSSAGAPRDDRTRPTLARLRSDPALHFTTRTRSCDVAEASLARANDAIRRLVRAAAEGAVRGRRDGRARGEALDDRLLPAAGGGRQPARQLLHQHDAARDAAALRGGGARVPRGGARPPPPDRDRPGARRPAGVPPARGATAFVEGWGLYTERLSRRDGPLLRRLDRFGDPLVRRLAGLPARRRHRAARDGLEPQARRSGSWSSTRPSPRTTSSTRSTATWRCRARRSRTSSASSRCLRLRARPRRRSAAAFDIRAFHDACSRQGAVGLATLGGSSQPGSRSRAGPAVDGSRGANPDLAAPTATRPGPSARSSAIRGSAGSSWPGPAASPATPRYARGMLLVAYEAGGALGVGLLGAARTAPAIITGPLTGCSPRGPTRPACCGSSTWAAPPLRSA